MDELAPTTNLYAYPSTATLFQAFRASSSLHVDLLDLPAKLLHPDSPKTLAIELLGNGEGIPRDQSGTSAGGISTATPIRAGGKLQIELLCTILLESIVPRLGTLGLDVRYDEVSTPHEQDSSVPRCGGFMLGQAGSVSHTFLKKPGSSMGTSQVFNASTTMKEMAMCLYHYERDGDVSLWLWVVKTNR